MAKLRHYIEYGVAAMFMRLIAALPRSTGDRLAAGIGWLAYRLLSSRRRIAGENLRKAFGPAMTEDQIEETTRRVFQNITRTMIEFAHFRHTTLDQVREMFVPDNEEGIRKVFAEGRGCFFVTAHFGNWELLGLWAATTGLPIHLLTGIQHNQLVDRMITSLRTKTGVQIMRADRRGSLEVVRALKQGHFVAVVADQHSAVGSTTVEFFGRPAAAPKGPAAFAYKAGCPLWPFLSRRERFDRHVMMAGKPIYPPQGVDADTAIQQMTQEYTRFFEDAIRRYPEQWMWTHRRWKLPEEGNFNGGQ